MESRKNIVYLNEKKKIRKKSVKLKVIKLFKIY